MKRLLMTTAALGLLMTSAHAGDGIDPRTPMICSTHAWDGFVNIRSAPNGVAMRVYPNNVPIITYPYSGDFVMDGAGYTWVHVTIDALNGWAMASSLFCPH